MLILKRDKKNTIYMTRFFWSDRENASCKMCFPTWLLFFVRSMTIRLISPYINPPIFIIFQLNS